MTLEEGVDAFLVVSDVFVEGNNQLRQHLHLTTAGLDNGWITREKLSLLDALEPLLDLEASVVAVKEFSDPVWLSRLQVFQGGPLQKKAGGQIALQFAENFQGEGEIFFERSRHLLHAAFALLDCSAAILRQCI